jgi:hypothetical protein
LEFSRDGRSIDRGDAAYGPSSIDSSTRRVKQIELWMAIARLRDDAIRTRRSHALCGKIKVDRWRGECRRHVNAEAPNAVKRPLAAGPGAKVETTIRR